MKRILVVTEANECVASGHLFECLETCNYLISKNIECILLVNSDMQDGLKRRININYYEYSKNIQNELEFLISFLREHRIDTVMFNLRDIKNEFVQLLKQKIDVCIISVDEFGNKTLDADIIVNPMIDSSFWKYDTKGKVYCGEQYLVLPLKLQEYHNRDKDIRDQIKKITVSMGGVDVGNSTIKLAKWLKDDQSIDILNLVLGGGYRQEEELREVVRDAKNVKIYRNIDFLSELFFGSDLAFCSGGNTLHELAVIGTPTIVIPSVPHEVKNGKAYEEKGFSYCASIAKDFNYDEFLQVCKKIKPYSIREDMSIAGKSQVDGKGYERIYDILCANDNSL